MARGNIMSTWQDQWYRVERYYKRFKAANDGFEGHGEPSDYYFDDMLAFFQNCFHLRDWLKTDGFFKPTKIAQSPFDYVESNSSLAICKDLANATKHMNLDPGRKSSTGHEPKTAGRSMAVIVGSPTIVRLQANIEHNGQLIDAFELATKCMKAWEDYLSLT